MDLNRVTLIGSLTKDPELKKLPKGGPVARFVLAINYRWEDSDQTRHERVEFHQVVAFGKLAEIIGAYVKLGSKVYVEGHLRTAAVDDGKRRKSAEVVADNLIMLGHRHRAQTPLTPPTHSPDQRTGAA